MITEDDKKLPFYLMSVGIRENQEHVTRPEGYPGYHWLHCTRGKGLLDIGGKEYLICENKGTLFCPGVPHEYYAVEEPWETHWVTFDGFAVSPLLEVLGFDRFGVFCLNGRQALDKALSDIYFKGVSKEISRGLSCSALLYQFLVQFKSSISPDNQQLKSQSNHRLQPVIQLMESKFNTDLTLEELAGIIGITPQHLCRLFKKAYNMRPFDYLTRLRIQKGKELVISPENPTITEVSGRVGFNDTSYFCAVFKEHEGITPNEFKKMYRRL